MTKKRTRRAANIVRRLSSRKPSVSPATNAADSPAGKNTTAPTPALRDEMRAYNEWRAKLGLRPVTLEEFLPVYERAHHPQRYARGQAVVKALDEAFGVTDTKNTEE